MDHPKCRCGSKRCGSNFAGHFIRKEACGVSNGCNIVPPHEQKPNPYLDGVVTFNYFFASKVMSVKKLLWLRG